MGPPLRELPTPQPITDVREAEPIGNTCQPGGSVWGRAVPQSDPGRTGSRGPGGTALTSDAGKGLSLSIGHFLTPVDTVLEF